MSRPARKAPHHHESDALIRTARLYEFEPAFSRSGLRRRHLHARDHHLADPGHAVEEMRRVIRPGGRLLIADVQPLPSAVVSDPSDHRPRPRRTAARRGARPSSHHQLHRRHADRQPGELDRSRHCHQGGQLLLRMRRVGSVEESKYAAARGAPGSSCSRDRRRLAGTRCRLRGLAGDCERRGHRRTGPPRPCGCDTSGSEPADANGRQRSAATAHGWDCPISSVPRRVRWRQQFPRRRWKAREDVVPVVLHVEQSGHVGGVRRAGTRRRAP